MEGIKEEEIENKFMDKGVIIVREGNFNIIYHARQ